MRLADVTKQVQYHDLDEQKEIPTEATMFTPLTSPELMLMLYSGREREILTEAAVARIVEDAHAPKLHPHNRFFVGAGSLLISTGRRLSAAATVRHQTSAA